MESLESILKRRNRPFNIDDYGGLKEDEFIKDEVIYCKKCGEKRMHVSEFIKVRCLCKCQYEEMEAEQAREKELERQDAIRKLQKASLMGERYQNVTFETTKTGNNATFDAAYARCKRYCEAHHEVLKDGLGIYIYGDKGTGKTHLTACMANELIKKRKQVLFTNFLEVSRMIRDTFSKATESESEYIGKITTMDFLFIDDLGTERVQSDSGDLWLQEKVFDILNKRYNAKKPTIFTSNYALRDLISERGMHERTVDRIAEMSNAIFKIEGESYRLKARKSELPF